MNYPNRSITSSRMERGTDSTMIREFLRDYNRMLAALQGVKDHRTAATLLNLYLFDQLSGETAKSVTTGMLPRELRNRRTGLPNPGDVISKQDRELLSEWAARLGDAAPAVALERGGSDRRTRGAWFTPESVARAMCRRAMVDYLELGSEYRSDTKNMRLSKDRAEALLERLERIRVIDPACGGGVFLLSMLIEIEHWYIILLNEADRHSPPSQTLRAKILSENIFGVDNDPLSVMVTRQRLWLKASREGAFPADWMENISCRDGLDSSPSDRQHFHIVVTNPPYGTKVQAEIRDRFFPGCQGTQSRDAYGLFIARALELLRPGGVAVLLVVDTWRTIRSHLPLRKKLLAESRVRTVISLPAGLFDATVSTCVLVIEKGTDEPAGTIEAGEITTRTLTVDALLRGNNEAAIGRLFRYPQRLPASCETAPVFIASPRIFDIVTERALPQLGDLADVRHGLTTGATRQFVYKRPDVAGAYRVAEQQRVFNVDRHGRLLSTEERYHGLEPDKFAETYLVPYDKGGAACSFDGWLPCYYVPTPYFIDWRREAVSRMKQLPGFRHDGRQFYFHRGITFSHTGMYAPTFRLGSGGVFDTAGSSMFPHRFDLYLWLAILNSKIVKYLLKNYINHSVNTAEGPLKRIPVAVPDGRTAGELKELVETIIAHQHEQQRYPYHRHEQPEIDRLMYGVYELKQSEINEVESWYAHRYPRLAAAR